MVDNVKTVPVTSVPNFPHYKAIGRELASGSLLVCHDRNSNGIIDVQNEEITFGPINGLFKFSDLTATWDKVSQKFVPMGSTGSTGTTSSESYSKEAVDAAIVEAHARGKTVGWNECWTAVNNALNNIKPK